MLQRWAALLVVVAVALAARVVGTSALRLPDGGVRPVSSDSHYYLRRIVATYQQFPHVPDLGVLKFRIAGNPKTKQILSLQ